MTRIQIIFGLLFIAQIAFPQDRVPIIRANSKDVTVLDGEHYRKGWWYIMPEAKPDFYVVENPKKPHKVTFYTDLDTISFDVKYNETHDFIILLNGKDSCLTRVTTIPAKTMNYRKNCNNCNTNNDTIPFSLGLDNKNYIKVRINNSGPINFQFDLGSTACIIKENMADDCNVVWNGTAEMGSVKGTATVKSSKNNQIQIGNLIWDSVGMFSTKHTNWGSKGIIGNNLLQDRVIELNYDNNIIVIHKTLPAISKDYVKVEMQIRDGVPYIPVIIDNGNTKAKNWFMFDNGYDNCLLVDNEFANTNGLYGTMKVVGHRSNSTNGKTIIVEAPKLFIGNYELKDVPIDLQNPKDKQSYDRVIIGNDVLKRFNVIIDYPNNFIYLKTSKLINEKYDRGNWLKVRVFIIGGAIVLTIIVLLVFRKLSKRKSLR
jgi:gag-polyprotein putative aspartyl protease